MEPEDELPPDDAGEETPPDDEQEPEYDEEGNEIVAETLPEAEGGETPPDEPEASYVPPGVPTGELPESARFRELLADPEVAAAIEAMTDAKIARQMQAMHAANMHVTQAAVEHPELFRQYGGRIQQTLSELPADTRSRPEAVNIAIARVVMEDAPKAGLAKTLRKLADLADGQPAQRQPASKAPIPAAQRPPSPSSRSSAPAPNEDRIKSLMSKYDVTRSEAQDMLSEVSRPLAGSGRRPL